MRSHHWPPILLSSIILFVLIHPISTSDCHVSQWGGWSACYGDCQYGQEVRNRDVTKPPMPEISSRGAPVVRICPHLYETRFCIPSYCLSATSAPKTLHRWKPSTKIFKSFWPSKTQEDEFTSSIIQKTSLSNGPFFPTLVSMNEGIREEETINPLFSLTRGESDPHISLQHRYRGRIEPQDHFTLRGIPTNVPSLQEHLESFAILTRKQDQLKKKQHKTTTTTQSTLSTTTDPLTADSFEDITVPTKAPSMQDVELMLTTTISAPTDNETQSPVHTPSSTQSTTRGMWQREINYIPNTRQHASEITKQLYITGEIVQTPKVAMDEGRKKPNVDCPIHSRCCKIEREVCPDGTEPFYVKRYYRPSNSKDCIPYSYPRCDKTLEMEEKPIQYSHNCQDLCFAIREKSISPLFLLSAEV